VLLPAEDGLHVSGESRQVQCAVIVVPEMDLVLQIILEKG
jgi:hypothetical protein